MNKKPSVRDSAQRAASKRIIPKRQLSKWEKERKRRRILGIIISVVIAGIVISGGIVAYVQLIKPWHQPIVMVNERVFDMNYFIKMIRVQRAAYYFKYGIDLSEYTEKQQGQYVVGVIQRNELVRQKAEELSKDIDVDIMDITDDDLNAEIQNYFFYDPDEELTPEQFNELVNNWLKIMGVSRGDFEEMEITPIILSERVQEAIGNDEYPIGETYPHIRVKAVLLGTEDKAIQAKEDWVEGFNYIVKHYLPAEYYPEYGYWLVMVTEGDGEGEEGELYINAILLATEEKAEEVATEFDGINFAELAEEYSIDDSTEDGGDMGWMSLEDIGKKFGDLDTIQNLDLNTLSMPVYQNYPDDPVEWIPRDIEESLVFDDYVFSDGVEEIISNPIRDTTYSTKGGYWLIKIYEPEEEDEQEEEGRYIQVILLDSMDEAEKVAAEIEDGGDFATLAKENSLDSSAADGGDLGWLSLDDMGLKFGEENIDNIQALELDTLSEPMYYGDISKQSGYWIIEVLDTDNRTLIKTHRDSYISEYYSEWFDGEMEAGKEEERIKDYLGDNNDKISWAFNHL